MANIQQLLILNFILVGQKFGGECVDPVAIINSKTGESFNDALLRRLLEDLSKISQGIKTSRRSYYAQDLAAVQAIHSLEESLFRLSKFYAGHLKAFSVNKILTGAGLQFSTIRCDQTISNRYPRFKSKLPTDWKAHGDSLYYTSNCQKNLSTTRIVLDRKRRSLHFSELLNHAIKERGHFRRRRSLIKINDPTVCGSQRLFTTFVGNLSLPGYPSRNYSAYIQCIWHIEVPIKHAVKIAFDEFKLESDKDCLFDSLEFFEGGRATSGASLGRYCGMEIPTNVRSKMNYLTIKFSSDMNIQLKGFSLTWNLTEPIYPHPGFMMASNIIVDQTGHSGGGAGPRSIIFKNPTTCGLASNDVFCYFQHKAFIISKIISTNTFPATRLSAGQFVEVIFEHIIDLKWFQSLYKSKTFCMIWNDTIPGTEYGSWTRRGGVIYKTGIFKTICHYERIGIYSLITEVPQTDDSQLFRYTGTWYAGIIFSTIWLVVLICQWVFSRRINVPEWLSLNQVLALLVFLGAIMSGMHLHFTKLECSLLAFLLYYFGLSVFIWQFLKAAQLSGKFDDFFAKGRNIYIFYFLFGWSVPLFIAGMAPGAKYFVRETTQSCWFALIGGTIWGYTAPTYFLVIGNAILLFNVWKKTEHNVTTFNHPELRKRIAKDILQLMLFILTWIFGLLCMLNRTIFYLQYIFCAVLVATVMFLSLSSKQRRPGFQRRFDTYAYDKQDEEDIETESEVELQQESPISKRKRLTNKAYDKWRKFRKRELKLVSSNIALRKVFVHNGEGENQTGSNQDDEIIIRTESGSHSERSRKDPDDEAEDRQSFGSNTSVNSDDQHSSGSESETEEQAVINQYADNMIGSDDDEDLQSEASRGSEESESEEEGQYDNQGSEGDDYDDNGNENGGLGSIAETNQETEGDEMEEEDNHVQQSASDVEETNNDADYESASSYSEDEHNPVAQKI